MYQHLNHNNQCRVQPRRRQSSKQTVLVGHAVFRFLFLQLFQTWVGGLREEIDHPKGLKYFLLLTQARDLWRLTASQIALETFVQGKENILLKDGRKDKQILMFWGALL